MDIGCLNVYDEFLEAITALQDFTIPIDSNIIKAKREKIRHNVSHEQLAELLEGAKVSHLRNALTELFDLFEPGKNSAYAIVNYYVNLGLDLGQIDIGKWCTGCRKERKLSDDVEQRDHSITDQSITELVATRGLPAQLKYRAEDDKITWQRVDGVSPDFMAQLVSAVGGEERYNALLKTFRHTVQLAIAYKYVHSPRRSLDEARHIQPLVMAQLRLVASAVSDTLQVKRWDAKNELEPSACADFIKNQQQTLIKCNPGLCVGDTSPYHHTLRKAKEEVEKAKNRLEEVKRQEKSSELVEDAKWKLARRRQAHRKWLNKTVRAIVQCTPSCIKHSSTPLDTTDPTTATDNTSLSHLCSQLCALQKACDGQAVLGLLSNGARGTVVLLRERVPTYAGYHMVRFPVARNETELFNYYLLACVFTGDQLHMKINRPAPPTPYMGRRNSKRKKGGRNMKANKRRAGTSLEGALLLGNEDEMSDLSSSGDESDDDAPPKRCELKGCNTYGNIGSVFLQPASVSLREDEMQYEDHQAALRWRRGEVEES